jgi:predicted permease
VGSGLLFQSFRSLAQVDAGYETDDIFSFQAAPNPREHGLRDGPTFARFHYDFMERLASLPSVQSVGLVATLPLDEGAGLTRFATERTEGDEASQALLHFTFVGGDYFQTMGIQLLRGQYLEAKDQATGDVDGIVSQAAADILWPDQEAIGRRFQRQGADGAWVRVVGIVEDIMLDDFRQESPDPMVYLPMVGHTERSWGVGTPAYVMKTPRAEEIAPEVRELIREVAPSAPVYRVFTMAGLAARTVSRLSFTLLTLGIAAGLALILGAVGLFGVLSYVVSERTREIGIRMALGAKVGELRRMIVWQGGRITLIGVVVGMAGALALTRVLDNLLFGVDAIDPPTLVWVSALMVLVALLASYVPARRASSVDPIRSLNAE